MRLITRLTRLRDQARICDIGLALAMSFFVVSCTTLPPYQHEIQTIRTALEQARDW